MLTMSERFVNAMRAEGNLTTTENGAVAHASTGRRVLDFFGVAGALRTRDTEEILRLFKGAFAEDPLMALKTVFYTRDIRGGLGERRTVQVILKYLAESNPDVVINNLELVPYFGYWKDLFVLENTPVEHAMFYLLKAQFDADLAGVEASEPISLLGKWLPGPDATSKESARLGRRIARKFGLTSKEYQASLRRLRAYLDIVERKMSANEWTEITYSQVPSRAMTIYRNAFRRHDEHGFEQFIGKVERGEEKINSATLYPYDIIERMGLGMNYGGFQRQTHLALTNFDRVLQEQWNALPNYVGEGENILVMADTSGSMVGRPLATSVGLAIYFAERNSGPFKNTFMTFSSRPSLVTLEGKTLPEKVACIPSIVQDTNLDSAFKLILDTAIAHNLTQADLPKSLVVISDMEINSGTEGDSAKTFHRRFTELFRQHGYEIPSVVYWNVNSRHDVFHATSDYPGVQLASGQSPSVFKSVLNSAGKTAYEMMVEVLNDERYSVVRL